MLGTNAGGDVILVIHPLLGTQCLYMIQRLDLLHYLVFDQSLNIFE